VRDLSLLGLRDLFLFGLRDLSLFGDGDLRFGVFDLSLRGLLLLERSFIGVRDLSLRAGLTERSLEGDSLLGDGLRESDVVRSGILTSLCSLSVLFVLLRFPYL